MIKTKCVYDNRESDDGKWILVDREWPKDIPKDKIDEWYPELAPSDELLSMWKEKKISLPEYSIKYWEEFRKQQELIEALVEKAIRQNIVLVGSEKDDNYSHRIILAEGIANTLKILATNEEMKNFENLINSNLDNELLGKIKELSPDFAEVWNERGNFLADMGKYEEALQSYDEAIKRRPIYVAAWINRGIALRNLGKLKETVESYDKGLELEPDNAEAWSNRGNALGDLGKHEEAIESYDQSLKLKPDYVLAWFVDCQEN